MNNKPEWTNALVYNENIDEYEYAFIDKKGRIHGGEKAKNGEFTQTFLPEFWKVV